MKLKVKDSRTLLYILTGFSIFVRVNTVFLAFIGVDVATDFK